MDDLHERAGSTNVTHLHGELMKATSTDNPNDPTQVVTMPKDNLTIKMGDKAKDGSQLRPFIVWFGEAVPMIEPAIDLVSKADILISLNRMDEARDELNTAIKRGIPRYALKEWLDKCK